LGVKPRKTCDRILAGSERKIDRKDGGSWGAAKKLKLYSRPNCRGKQNDFYCGGGVGNFPNKKTKRRGGRKETALGANKPGNGRHGRGSRCSSAALRKILDLDSGRKGRGKVLADARKSS